MFFGLSLQFHTHFFYVILLKFHLEPPQCRLVPFTFWVVAGTKIGAMYPPFVDQLFLFLTFFFPLLSNPLFCWLVLPPPAPPWPFYHISSGTKYVRSYFKTKLIGNLFNLLLLISSDCIFHFYFHLCSLYITVICFFSSHWHLFDERNYCGVGTFYHPLCILKVIFGVYCIGL